MPQTLEEYHAKIERMMAEGDALVAARDPATAAASHLAVVCITLAMLPLPSSPPEPALSVAHASTLPR